MKLKKTAAMVVSAACLTVCAGMSMSASAACYFYTYCRTFLVLIAQIAQLIYKKEDIRNTGSFLISGHIRPLQKSFTADSRAVYGNP